ncbi:hypothetical protein BCR36DRAFT_368640 [Piromyces finnis]|uniref:Uncharacterized protein n=1 Tax=Piromyces finnis TaxID=1754191 RepID=A0A1Y1VEP2_9FUNG|nr:hypothetical protein BCR36DRAFT_368640 [Piromyces finnis]|eukprot:ORX54258.1 hypothetical protein BCR36DRAFT_368640 [Piromyces finnis]
MLFYFKKNKNPNASPRIQLTSLNKELHSLRNNSIDFAEKWRNSYIKFTSKLQLSGTSASFWAENENDPQLYECLNEISIYLTDFETQSKSWLSYQKQWIILLKELSEKEMNYINKEKEYFKILNKLHEITKQIRNYDQEEENKLKNNKIVLKKNNNDGRNSHHEKFSRDIKEEIQEEINKRREGEGEKEKEEEEKSIIIRQVKPVKIDNTKTPSKEDLNPDRNKLNKNKFKKSKQNKNINENNKTKNDEVFNKSIRQKNSYHHLIHLQHKLKKEFLRYFNENQKQLDTIYLIKELKIPTILYKLIQEYSKLWNKFLYTYGKLNGTFQKLQSLSSDKITPNKNTVQKLNLNFDEYDKVMLILEKENDYVKQYHPTKAQHDHLKSWIRNQGKWIRVLEEVFQHQKNHIQFVSKWLHESYKLYILK